MSNENSIRALRNPEYRTILAAEISHPAGLQELEDAALASITGGCAGVPGCTGGGGGGPFNFTSFLSSCAGPGQGGCP